MKTPSPSWRSQLLQTLPGYIVRPLGYLPAWLTGAGFATLCNRFFAEALAADGLAFLEQRVLRIVVEDAGIELALSYRGRQLHAAPAGRPAEVTIRGTHYNLLLLISQREDADTLFFQRRLRLEGETELGLYLKNFLDAWEPPGEVRFLQQVVANGMSWVEQFAGASPISMPSPAVPSNSHRRPPSA